MIKCRVYLEDGIFYGYEEARKEWFFWDKHYQEWEAIDPPKNKDNMLIIDEYNEEYLDTPGWHGCDGCQRVEVHKMCPAHGTPWYMSGPSFPYTKDIENMLKTTKIDPQALFDLIKNLPK